MIIIVNHVHGVLLSPLLGSTLSTSTTHPTLNPSLGDHDRPCPAFGPHHAMWRVAGGMGKTRMTSTLSCSTSPVSFPVSFSPLMFYNCFLGLLFWVTSYFRALGFFLFFLFCVLQRQHQRFAFPALGVTTFIFYLVKHLRFTPP